jgi:tuftelin-interacting protein 11
MPDSSVNRDDEEDDDFDFDDAQIAPRGGLGSLPPSKDTPSSFLADFVSSPAMARATAGSSDDNSDISSPGEADDYGAGPAAGSHALPAAFGGGAAQRRRRPRTRQPVDEVDVAAEAAAAHGQWERHTKGVGSRLMQQMGFTGRLGAREDGIAEPVTARLRPEKLGLGARGFVEKTLDERTRDELRRRDDATAGQTEDADQNADGESGRGAKRWLKKGATTRGNTTGTKKGKPTRLKLVDLYTTATSLRADAKATTAAASAADAPADAVLRSARRTDMVVDMRHGDPVVVPSVADALLRLDGNEDLNGVLEAPRVGDDEGPFDVPEVAFNLRILLDTAEADVQISTGRLATEKLLQANADEERDRLLCSLLEAERELRDAEELQDELTVLISAAEGPKSEVEVDTFISALEKFATSRCVRRELYSSRNAEVGSGRDPCGIRDAVVAVVEPRAAALASTLIKTSTVMLTDVKDLAASASAVSTAKLSAMLLATEPVLGDRDVSEQYMRLVCRVVLLPLRRTIGSRWNPHEPDTLVDLVSGLRAALPISLLAVLVDDVLVPRLVHYVSKWSPTVSVRNERLPLHMWIFPWLPVLGRRSLGPVLSEVRTKLTSVIRAWSIGTRSERGRTGPMRGSSNSTTLALIGPWKGVLSRTKFQHMIKRMVVPTLTSNLDRYMSNTAAAVVVPGDGCEYETRPAALSNAVAWREVIGVEALGAVLMTGMFRHLVRSLHSFLFTADDDMSEDDAAVQHRERAAAAAEWYSMWRARMPEEWFAEQQGDTNRGNVVRGGLAALLFVIHASSLTREVSARQVLVTADALVLLHNGYGSRPAKASTSPASASRREKQRVHAPEGQGQRATLKETVRALAERHGVEFCGTGKTTFGGVAVYTFGQARVQLDGVRQVLLIDEGPNAQDRFRPVNIAELLRRAGCAT